jgi:hypothetical protein
MPARVFSPYGGSSGVALEYIAMNIRPVSQAKFAKQGVRLTLLNILMGNMDGRENQEAIDWLAVEERRADRREAVRFRWMLLFTVVAAVAASIAAWPVIKEWSVVTQLLSISGH